MRARIQVTQYRENYQTENLVRNALYSTIVGNEASHLSLLSLYQVSLWWLKYWRNNECLPGCIQKQEGLRDNGAKLWELRVSQANESSSSTDHASHETMDKRKKTFLNYQHHLKFSWVQSSGKIFILISM